MQVKNWLPVAVCGLMLLSSGCVCGPGGACGGFNLGPVAYRSGDCGSCASKCDSGQTGEFYSGAGPLAGFFGLTQAVDGSCGGDCSGGGCSSSCGGGGCGELYVDEWINERPMVDQCGHEECLQCGRSPVRSLLHLIMGRQYQAGCETCACEGSVIGQHGAIVHDGYSSEAWSGEEGCNCGAGAGHTHHFDSPLLGSSHTTVEPTDRSHHPSHSSPSTIHPAPIQPNQGQGSGEIRPTPAPALPPSSASRLNPAARRIIR